MNTAKKLISLLTVMLACISLNAQVTTFDDTCTCPPQFPDGDAELIQFLNENIQYPRQAARDKIEGKVVVQFMVKKTGKIDKVKVLRSVRKDLDKEAVRVIKMMPDFIPGKQNGETVDMLYTVPVAFKLFDEMEPLTVSEGSDAADKAVFGPDTRVFITGHTSTPVLRLFYHTFCLFSTETHCTAGDFVIR